MLSVKKYVQTASLYLLLSSSTAYERQALCAIGWSGETLRARYTEKGIDHARHHHTANCTSVNHKNLFMFLAHTGFTASLFNSGAFLRWLRTAPSEKSELIGDCSFGTRFGLFHSLSGVETCPQIKAPQPELRGGQMDPIYCTGLPVYSDAHSHYIACLHLFRKNCRRHDRGREEENKNILARSDWRSLYL